MGGSGTESSYADKYFGWKGFFCCMTWSISKFNGYCVINLPKNVFKKENIALLKRIIEDLSEEGFKTFLLNMEQITKIDDNGLGMLLGLYKFSFYHEINIRLYKLQSYVSQLIFQTRLNIIFDICDKDDEILKEKDIKSKLIA